MPSKPANTERWLLDIRHNIHLAQKFVDGLSYEQFRDDLRAFYAATRCLEIISEASRRLPPELKERHPSIPWNRMAGAGNVYRHDYEDVEQAARLAGDPTSFAGAPCDRRAGVEPFAVAILHADLSTSISP